LNYRIYNQSTYRNIPQVREFIPESYLTDIDLTAMILPFKVNNYVTDELINWNQWQEDPMFILTFPNRDMLKEHHYRALKEARSAALGHREMKSLIEEQRLQLNPHPAGQLEKNVPEFQGRKLTGIQHKYEQTVLFFPSHGQTCHAYCSFCFRWPQFTGMDEYKFAMKETELLIDYVNAKPEVTDILITGGDPMVMTAERLRTYIDPILKERPGNLTNIRIGSKSLSYWPYRYLSDPDADDILRVFEDIVDSGINLAFMAHFNHSRELETEAVRKASRRILNTGARINTQSPLLRHINDSSEVWQDMWRQQLKLGMTPYYFFVARDTGSHDYFAVTLEEAVEVYRKAYRNMSGLARTVRGPSMSASPGKVHVLGRTEIMGEDVFMLKFIQARNPDWVGVPFFAKYDSEATWLDELSPAFGEDRFFFENN